MTPPAPTATCPTCGGSSSVSFLGLVDVGRTAREASAGLAGRQDRFGRGRAPGGAGRDTRAAFECSACAYVFRVPVLVAHDPDAML